MQESSDIISAELPAYRRMPIGRLILYGLMEPGGHHKQWYLEQILLAMWGEMDVDDLHKSWNWERGIEP